MWSHNGTIRTLSWCLILWALFFHRNLAWPLSITFSVPLSVTTNTPKYSLCSGITFGYLWELRRDIIWLKARHILPVWTSAFPVTPRGRSCAVNWVSISSLFPLSLLSRGEGNITSPPSSQNGKSALPWEGKLNCLQARQPAWSCQLSLASSAVEPSDKLLSELAVNPGRTLPRPDPDPTQGQVPWSAVLLQYAFPRFERCRHFPCFQ